MAARPGEGEPITVALSGGHAMMRAGLRLLLERDPGVSVLDGNEIEAADVIVLDLETLEPLAAVRAAAPDAAIVLLTGSADPELLGDAVRRGAASVVAKAASPQRLIDAIRDAAADRSEVGSRSPAHQRERGPADLSAREIEVLRLIADGHTNRAAADRLVLSVRTVEAHRARIQAKLKVSGRAGLVARARELGLL